MAGSPCEENSAYATWHTARLFPGGMTSINMLSCRARGDCTASGNGTFVCTQTVCGNLANYVLDEKNGVWGSPWKVPGTLVFIDALSCGSPGNCAAGGSYQPSASAKQQAFLVPGLGA